MQRKRNGKSDSMISSPVRLLSGIVVALLLILGIVNAVICIDSIPLWDQDEAAYAGFSLRMAREDDWLVPDFMWSDIHRKPPLHFWLMAAAMKLLGPSFLAVRLHSVLCMFFTIIMVFLLGRRVFGRGASAWASFMILVSLVPAFGKVAVVDSLLLMLQTTAVLSLLLAFKEGEAGWTFLFWISVSLGTLAKGPPILLLTGGIFLTLAVFHPGRRKLLRLHPWLGLPLALFPLYLWGRAAWAADGGETIRWMLDFYLGRRIGGTVLGHTGPPGYYLLLFIPMLFPWLAFLPEALKQLWNRRRERDAEALGLLGWLGFGWLIYEMIPSKLGTYALGAVPGMALAIGLVLSRLDPASPFCSKWIRKPLAVQGIMAAAMGAGLVAAAFTGFPGVTAWTLVPAGVLVIAASLLGLRLMLRSRNPLSGLMVSLVGWQLFILLVWTWGVPAITSQFFATREVARIIIDRRQPDMEVVFSKDFSLPSLPFYLYRDSIPFRQLDSPEDAEGLFGDAGVTVLLTNDRGYGILHESGAPLHSAQRHEIIEGINPDRGSEITWHAVWLQR